MLDVLLLIGAMSLASICVMAHWIHEAFDLDEYCPYCDSYAPYPCQACGRVAGKERR